MEGRTYKLQPDKNLMRQGYYMADENGEIAYEAKVLKNPIFGAAQVDFINHKTGQTTQHKIGKVITSSMSTGIGGLDFTDFLSIKSSYKYDGQKIWDYLHAEGVRLNSHMSSEKIGMTYELSVKGQPIAMIATSTPKGKSILTTDHIYDVTVADENIDMAFLVAFSIARTEQMFYS